MIAIRISATAIWALVIDRSGGAVSFKVASDEHSYINQYSNYDRDYADEDAAVLDQDGAESLLSLLYVFCMGYFLDLHKKTTGRHSGCMRI